MTMIRTFIRHPRTALPLSLLSLLSLLCAGLFAATQAHADQDQDQRQAGVDIADLSIEELANIEVTSVSRRPERLQDAPASVFVITADDIRRAGTRSLPEALRLAPNLNVAQSSNADYFISARGMNGASDTPANKLQVMIDGRTVYSPLYSGMFWDEADVMLEDVERIEVISGPGGTLWGVNAVNGVINVITRRARDTQGDLAVLRADENGGQAEFRHGAAGPDGAWRVYGKAFGIGHGEMASGRAVDDDWTQAQIGLRGDWTRDAERFSLNANAWRGREGQPQPGLFNVGAGGLALDDITIHGGNVTGRWDHALADGGSLAVTADYDYRFRRIPPVFGDAVDIADVQLQHALPALGAHSIVWGGEYRYSWDHVDNSRYLAFLPANDTQAWASLFGQDEIALRDSLRLTAGARVERNPYTGAEFLPNLRLSWRATPAHQFWAALSRTVRAPTRLDEDAHVPAQPPYILNGGELVRAETARVLELGYRGQFRQVLSYSMAVYRNLYDHLRTQDFIPNSRIVVFGSDMMGHANGAEAWGNLQLSDVWRMSAGLTALHEVFSLRPGSHDLASVASSGRDPAYTGQLRSSYSVDSTRELELAVRHVGALATPYVPAYDAVDLRFGWRIARGVELSVIGTNLNGGHAEYGTATVRTEVPRTVGVKLTWQR